MRGFWIMAAFVALAAPQAAADPVWLGHARLFTNDAIGDGKDRWRSGSYGLSFVRGTAWNGHAPASFGELVEYRFRSEILAPGNLSDPLIGTDRPYAGVLQFGAFSHMQRGGTDLSVGLDMVITGPQTGLGAFQSFVHNGIGLGAIAVLGSQIGNHVYPTLGGEISREFTLFPDAGRRVVLRPFSEAAIGAETFVRFGGDITFGNAGKGDFQVRDPSTGFRATAMFGPERSDTSVLIGADIAFVQSSRFLPASGGYRLTPYRLRLRTGYVFELKHGSVFYGLTWLGREFVNQPKSQVVGSLSLRLDF